MPTTAKPGFAWSAERTVAGSVEEPLDGFSAPRREFRFSEGRRTGFVLLRDFLAAPGNFCFLAMTNQTYIVKPLWEEICRVDQRPRRLRNSIPAPDRLKETSAFLELGV
jgi:hypothetical protein